MEKAREAYLRHQNNTPNLKKLIYGQGKDPNCNYVDAYGLPNLLSARIHGPQIQIVIFPGGRLYEWWINRYPMDKSLSDG